MRQTTINQIKTEKVIAIFRGIKTEQVENTARALFEGGIRLMEITFNPVAPDTFEETLSSIQTIVRIYGKSVSVGAGTVRSVEQVNLARQAGATYIISPHFDPAIIERTLDSGMVSIPGVLTATETISALNAGADFVKLFPASTVGPSYLKAILAPVPDASVLVVGGIDKTNVRAFLEAGALGAAVGSNLVNLGNINSGIFEAITEDASEFIATVKGDIRK